MPRLVGSVDRARADRHLFEFHGGIYEASAEFWMMAMKSRLQMAPQIAALVCGVLEDNGRVLFLKRKDITGRESIELPCVLIMKGENPVAALTSAFRTRTGIDGQVHDVLFERQHNIGSRKRKKFVPVLCFRVTAKNMSARPPSEFTGFAWKTFDDARKEKKNRNSEWLI